MSYDLVADREKAGAMTDGAVDIRAMYVAHREACKLAGVPPPTIEQWIALIEERINQTTEEGAQGAITKAKRDH